MVHLMDWEASQVSDNLRKDRNTEYLLKLELRTYIYYINTNYKVHIRHDNAIQTILTYQPLLVATGRHRCLQCYTTCMHVLLGMHLFLHLPPNANYTPISSTLISTDPYFPMTNTHLCCFSPINSYPHRSGITLDNSTNITACGYNRETFSTNEVIDTVHGNELADHYPTKKIYKRYRVS